MKRALILAAVALLWGATAWAQEATMTLSLRTTDGLIVLSGPKDAIMKAADAVRAGVKPPVTNDAVLSLVHTSPGAGSVRANAYIATGGAKTPIRMRVETTTVEKGVEDGVIPNIMGRPLEEAYLMVRSEGDVFLLLKDGRPPSGWDLGHAVFVFSSLTGMPPKGLFVDGVRRGSDSMGYTVAAFAPDGTAFLGTKAFDTFSDPKAAGAMESFLNSLPQGAYAALMANFGVGFMFSGGMIQAMDNFGMTTALNAELPMSHAMIGKKGAARGTALEATRIYGDSKVVYFNDALYIDPADAQTLAEKSTARTVILGGTRATDTVMILERQ